MCMRDCLMRVLFVCISVVCVCVVRVLFVFTGELCGECRDGKGVSALLNKCTTCSDASSLLILALSKKQLLPIDLIQLTSTDCIVTLDAGVFVFLLIVMKPFPTWLYPCVFYLQVCLTESVSV